MIKIANSNDLITCKTHGVQRLAKFCTPTPIFNADREVIGYSYVCTSSTQCASARDRTTTIQTPSSAVAPERSFIAPVHDARISDDTLDKLESSGAKVFTPGIATQSIRGPSRYYDLSNNAARTDQRPKKVCWSCGMDSHEKPQCRNQLCKRCHGILANSSGAYGSSGHDCEEILPSPFVLLAPLSDEELKYVRCSVCHGYGHMDCRSTNLSDTKTLSCCHCGESGHHGFDCPQHQYPDRWVQCVLAVGRNMAYRQKQFPEPQSSIGRHQQSQKSDNEPSSKRYRRDDEYDRDSSRYHNREALWKETSNAQYSQRNRRADYDTAQETFNNQSSQRSNGNRYQQQPQQLQTYFRHNQRSDQQVAASSNNTHYSSGAGGSAGGPYYPRDGYRNKYETVPQRSGNFGGQSSNQYPPVRGPQQQLPSNNNGSNTRSGTRRRRGRDSDSDDGMEF